MAARRKRIAKAPAGEADRAFTIVLEDLHSRFNVFGEALQAVREDVQGLRGEVHGLRTEIHGVRDELHGFRAEVATRFEGVDRELGLVKVVLVEHTRDIREIRGELRDVRNELGDVQATVTRVEGALDRKVDRDEVASIVARGIETP